MHEYPITLEIIRIASEAAKERNAVSVSKISLVIGDLSGYVGESIHMYFDEISKGTICEGCALEIERIKPKVQCSACGELFERKLLSFECPFCGGEAHPTKIGTEFFIKSIEAMVDEENTRGNSEN